MLAPTDAPPLAGTTPPARRKRSTTHRKVQDSATWFEAWNQYLGTRVAHDPVLALPLIKYQTLMSMLFVHYPPAACIEYDRLFRQTAATDHSTHWDRLKEDIFVWALTRPAHTQPLVYPASPGTRQTPPTTASLFRGQPQQQPRTGAQQSTDRPPIASRLGPPPATTTARPKPARPKDPTVSHNAAGQEICKRYNWGRCSKTDCVFAHTCWTPGCNGAHPAPGCPKRPQ